jgi:hypothetical protein
MNMPSQVKYEKLLNFMKEISLLNFDNFTIEKFSRDSDSYDNIYRIAVDARKIIKEIGEL